MNDNGIDVFLSHNDLMELSSEYRSNHNNETEDISEFYKKSMGLLSYTYFLYRLCQFIGLDDHANELKSIQKDKNDIWKNVHKEFSSHNTNE